MRDAHWYAALEGQMAQSGASGTKPVAHTSHAADPARAASPCAQGVHDAPPLGASPPGMRIEIPAEGTPVEIWISAVRKSDNFRHDLGHNGAMGVSRRKAESY